MTSAKANVTLGKTGDDKNVPVQRGEGKNQILTCNVQNLNIFPPCVCAVLKIILTVDF